MNITDKEIKDSAVLYNEHALKIMSHVSCEINYKSKKIEIYRDALDLYRDRHTGYIRLFYSEIEYDTIKFPLNQTTKEIMLSLFNYEKSLNIFKLFQPNAWTNEKFIEAELKLLQKVYDEVKIMTHLYQY